MFSDATPSPRSPRPTVAGWGACWFFCVLASYYAIRPVREALGVAEGSGRLRWLFTGTLVALLLASPLYGWIVRRTPPRWLATLVYGFFATNLLLFWLGFRGIDSHSVAEGFLHATFYVWVSVFNLYAVTVFWSHAVDAYTGADAKRVFGLIAAAGTLGGLCGSELTRQILRVAPDPRSALLMAAAWLVGAIVAAHGFRRAVRASVVESSATPVPTSATGELRDAFRGLSDVARDPYLRVLTALIVLMSIAGTGVYMQMSDLVRIELPDVTARTDWYARLNNYQNGLTLLGQAWGARRLMERGGLGLTLAIVPAAYLGGFAAIATAPSLAVLGAVDVAQRVASFAAGVPAREVLFTVVSGDQKYRAKSFIDTVGKRAGDALAAHAYAALRGFGWTPVAIAWATMPFAAAIGAASAVAVRQFQRKSEVLAPGANRQAGN